MKRSMLSIMRAALIVAPAVLVSGCVVEDPSPGPVAYAAPAPGYYAPGYYAYDAPYYGPNVYIGGGWHGDGWRHDGWRGYHR